MVRFHLEAVEAECCVDGGGNRSRAEGRGLTPRSRTLSLKNRRLTCTYQPNCICGMNSQSWKAFLSFFWRPPALENSNSFYDIR